MKGYIFGPTSTAGVIKRTTINFADDLPEATPIRTSVITPGLKSDGTPTSNTALSININDIDAGDDYGFAKSITEY